MSTTGTVFIPGRLGGGDLTEPLSESVRKFMIANWPDAAALVQSTDIKFGTFWWDGYGSYQIHFLDRMIDRKPYVLGWNMEYAYDYVDCHVFVRLNSPIRPQQLDDMKRSIATVVLTNRAYVPGINTQGSATMRVMRVVDITPRTFVDDLWHSIVQLEIGYIVASTV